MWGPDTMPFWIFFAIVAGFVAVGFTLMIHEFGAKKIAIRGNLEEHVLIQRFLTSPECFLYSEKSISQSLDYTKFSGDRLNTCFLGTDKKHAFQLTLALGGKETQSIKTNNWIDAKKTAKSYILPVSVMVSNQKVAGELSVEIQNPY